MSCINKKNTLLDYGCGVGSLTYYFSKFFNESIGVDVSEKAIQIANQSIENVKSLNNVVKFFTLKNFDNKTHTNRFDLIICSEVIEHVKDDKELIKKMFRYSRKKGILFLSTPSLNAPLYRLGLLKNFDVRVGHLRRYSVDNLVKLVEHEGFVVKKVIKTEGILRNSLYTLKPLGFIVRFIKGPLVTMFSILDDYLVVLFGESDIQVIAQKP